MSYRFTYDWFSGNIDGIKKVAGSKVGSILEIGSYEGRSTVWFLENLLSADGLMVCIDNWRGGLEHGGINMQDVEARFRHNVELARKPTQSVRVYRQPSIQGLSERILENRTFEVIYIDGSHTASDVLTDACLSYALLAVGGVMIFDDYFWDYDGNELHRPRIAIDAFCKIFSERIRAEVIGGQVAVTRIA